MQTRSIECWAATRKETGDRVFLRMLANVRDSDWLRIVDRVDRQRGLLHENITLISDTGIHETASGNWHYLAEPWIASGHPFDPGGPPTESWPVLSRLLDALIYAHDLGFPHGNLHPGNLLLDRSGKLHITGYGLDRNFSANTDAGNYLSPQVIAGISPNLSDDIYSLGCLIFHVLTGKGWQPGREPDSPLSPGVNGMLSRMLGETALDRQVSLTGIRDLLKGEFEGTEATITSTSFSRVEPSAKHREPSARHKEPSAKHKGPSAEHKEPSAKHREPSARHKEPSAKHREPSARHREPSAEHKEPSARHKEPSAEHKEPSARHKEPSAEHKEPSARHREPSARHREPSARHREPSARHKEPSANTSSANRSYRHKKALPALLVASAATGLALAGLLLFLLLPETLITSAPQEGATPASNVQPKTGNRRNARPALAPGEQAALELMQQKSEETAREILRLQLQLETLGIGLWAQEEYDAMTLSLDAADAAWREQAYEQALASYEGIRDRLQQLLDSSDDLLASQAETGRKALEAGKPDEALAALTIATTIDPSDADLQQLLSRAANLEEVLHLVRQAETARTNGDLDTALERFGQARDMDAEWQPARLGYEAASQALTLRQFQAAMSAGFVAISEKNYAVARESFNRAGSILPDSGEPEDALLQVQQAEHQDQINEYRVQALAHEITFDWSAAIAAYKAALAITPTLEFALAGLAAAEQRLGLRQSLETFLADPTRLQSDTGLETARDLLRKASRTSPLSEAMQGNINLLARFVSSARVKMPVTLRSDGNTSITLRKHAELGKLTSRVVYLIPGRYVIVGTRPGYRDVRKDLVLIAGKPVPEISIVSRERVR